MRTKKLLVIVVCIMLIGGLAQPSFASSQFKVQVFTASAGTSESAVASVNFQMNAFFNERQVAILSSSAATVYIPSRDSIVVTISVTYKK